LSAYQNGVVLSPKASSYDWRDFQVTCAPGAVEIHMRNTGTRVITASTERETDVIVAPGETHVFSFFVRDNVDSWMSWKQGYRMGIFLRFLTGPDKRPRFL
jgi:hypothetical protein